MERPCSPRRLCGCCQDAVVAWQVINHSAAFCPSGVAPAWSPPPQSVHKESNLMCPGPSIQLFFLKQFLILLHFVQPNIILIFKSSFNAYFLLPTLFIPYFRVSNPSTGCVEIELSLRKTDCNRGRMRNKKLMKLDWCKIEFWILLLLHNKHRWYFKV